VIFRLFFFSSRASVPRVIRITEHGLDPLLRPLMNWPRAPDCLFISRISVRRFSYLGKHIRLLCVLALISTAHPPNRIPSYFALHLFPELFDFCPSHPSGTLTPFAGHDYLTPPLLHRSCSLAARVHLLSFDPFFRFFVFGFSMLIYSL